MVWSMVAADTLFAYRVLGRSGVFNFACGPGDDDDALVADLGSSCIRMGGQSGMVRPHVYILDENKIPRKFHRPGKITKWPADGPSLNSSAEDLCCISA